MNAEEAHRVVLENLVLMSVPTADETRELLSKAVACRDAETVRREGHSWSGAIGLSLLNLADAIEADTQNTIHQHTERKGDRA